MKKSRTWREPLGGWFILALLLLPVIWVGLNAGPWNLSTLEAAASLGGLRALAPLTALAGAGILLWKTRDADRESILSSPAGLLLVYGLIALASSLLVSPDRLGSVYWGINFLALPVLWVAVSTSREPVLNLRGLLRATLWIVTAIALLVLVLALWHEGLGVLLTSGTVRRLFGNYDDVAAPALAINANGAGRFAALALLFTLSGLFTHRLGLRSVPYVLAAGAFALLLVYTQSRGSLAAFAVALTVFLALYLGWKVTAGGLAAGGLAAAAVIGPGALAGYLSRGQSIEQLVSLTGRTDIWGTILGQAISSPIWGYGFHADRILLGLHVHNAWLHAFIQAGVIGLLAFAAAWFLGVRGAVRAGLIDRFRDLPRQERGLAILASSVLVFLLVRSIPESTAAFFGVDLLIFLPTAAYLHALGKRHGGGGAGQETPDPGPAGPTYGRHRVLACAYACAPPGTPTFHGGEEHLGWRLVQQLSRRNTVHALVSAEHRESIESVRGEEPNPRVRYHYVSLPSWMGWMREHQGTIQLYAYIWQVKAYLEARRLVQRFDYDLFHHITYANDWMASHAGALLDVPYVRGPGGGAHHIPGSFQAERGIGFRLAQQARKGLQWVLRRDPFFVMGQTRARKLLVCNQEAYEALKPRWQEKAELFPVTGIDATAVGEAGSTNGKGDGGGFKVTTAGTLRSVKSFDLAIRGFARYLEDNAVQDAQLVILGDGPDRDHLEALAARLGITDSVVFEGWQDHPTVLDAMAGSDAFLFTSLRDGGGAVVVEAMAMGVPVVCFDHAGPGLHVDEASGIKVEPGTPDQAVEALGDALSSLAENPDRRQVMGKRARARALEAYDWDRLGDRIQAIYEEISPTSLQGEPAP